MQRNRRDDGMYTAKNTDIFYGRKRPAALPPLHYEYFACFLPHLARRGRDDFRGGPSRSMRIRRLRFRDSY